MFYACAASRCRHHAAAVRLPAARVLPRPRLLLCPARHPIANCNLGRVVLVCWVLCAHCMLRRVCSNRDVWQVASKPALGCGPGHGVGGAARRDRLPYRERGVYPFASCLALPCLIGSGAVPLGRLLCLSRQSMPFCAILRPFTSGELFCRPITACHKVHSEQRAEQPRESRILHVCRRAM